MDEIKTKISLYDNPDNFNFDTDKIEIVDNKAKLKIQEGTNYYEQDYSNPDNFVYEADKVEFTGGKVKQKANAYIQNYLQEFTSDSGFTYDSAKAEFVGGVLRQKTLRPTDATCGATYTNDINLSWGNGVLTGTGTGSPTVSGGKLVLTGGTKFVQYQALNNADSLQVGCIRFKYTPNYSGVPITTRFLMTISQSVSNTKNLITLYVDSTGHLYLIIKNYLDASIISTDLGFWNPTAGTEYEFELNWDITAGATRLFINGTQKGTTQTQTGIRSGTIGILNIGAKYDGNFMADAYFNDIEIFSTVQHTANYTPGYTIPEIDYVESKASCPIVSYTYPITSFAIPTITESDAPHYTINGYYWNGAAWTASSDTYATAMTKDQWIANIATFPGAQFGSNVLIKIYFTDTNIQGSIDIINFDINEYRYLTSIVTLPEMEHVGIGTLLIAYSFETEDYGEPRYAVQIDQSGNYLYWNGSAWAVSNNTYAQATNEITFNEHIEALPVAGATYGQFRIYFNAGIIQQWVDLTTIALYESTGYSTDAQRIKPITRFRAKELISFAETATKASGTALKYTIEIDGQEKYWNGSTVVKSDGTYAQSNMADELNDNILNYINDDKWIRLIALLKTTNNQVTPYLEAITFTYYPDITFRDNLNEILNFIETETLTDVEFESLTITESSSDVEIYNALLAILEDRESVSNIMMRLYYYFMAKGAILTEPIDSESNIFLGAAL